MLIDDIMPDFLSEAFDSSAQIHWFDRSSEDESLLQAEFQIDDGHFIIQFINRYYNPGLWTLSFVRNGTLDMTGTGDAMKVISTVIRATREFIREKNPRFFNFAAKNDEPSRLKLYSRLISQFAREFPQFTQEPPKISGGHTELGFKRPPTPFVAPEPEPVPQEPVAPMSDEEWDELEAWFEAQPRR